MMPERIAKNCEESCDNGFGQALRYCGQMIVGCLFE